MYKGWSHSPISTLALCLLAEAYEHATHLLDRIADLEVTVNTYDEAGMLARIIDQPQFSKLRLQLLDSRKSACKRAFTAPAISDATPRTGLPLDGRIASWSCCRTWDAPQCRLP